MNKAILTGRLTKDPEHRTTPNGVSVTTFTVAVNRRYKDEEGTYPADFINCIAWRSTADFISKYFQKGSGIGIVGSIQSRSYEDKNGNRRYVTEVIAEEVEFTGSKKSENKEASYDTNPDNLFGEEIAGFEPVEDPHLPF